MSSRGYCTLAELEVELGEELSEAARAAAVLWLGAVEAAIDAFAGRSFGRGPQVEALAPAATLLLAAAPVSSITSVTGRAGPGATPVTLTSPTDYELIDATAGMLRLARPSAYDLVTVGYVPDPTIPLAVTRAAVLTLADWLAPTRQPGLRGVQRYRLPDLEVQFVAGGGMGGLPPAAQALLARWPGVA